MFFLSYPSECEFASLSRQAVMQQSTSSPLQALFLSEPQFFRTTLQFPEGYNDTETGGISSKNGNSLRASSISDWNYVSVLCRRVRTTDWLIGWLIDGLIDWMIDWLIDWMIDSLIDWLIGWLVDWLIIFANWCVFLLRMDGFVVIMWCLWNVMQSSVIKMNVPTGCRRKTGRTSRRLHPDLRTGCPSRDSESQLGNCDRICIRVHLDATIGMRHSIGSDCLARDIFRVFHGIPGATHRCRHFVRPHQRHPPDQSFMVLTAMYFFFPLQKCDSHKDASTENDNGLATARALMAEGKIVEAIPHLERATNNASNCEVSASYSLFCPLFSSINRLIEWTAGY